MTLIIILLMAAVVSAMLAFLTTRLINSALFLAAVSVFMSVTFFALGFPMAGVAELSVCAGLITAIFISAISMVKPMDKEELDARRSRHYRRYLPLAVLLPFAGFVLYSIFGNIFSTVAAAQLADSTDFYNALWNLRQTDLLGQVLILLVGSFGIVIIFREK